MKPYAAVLVFCNLSMMAIAIATNLPPVYFTAFSSTFGGEIGLTAEQLGRIGAFVFIGFVIGLMITIPLGDRLGAKLFVLLGNALVAVGLVMMGVSPNYDILLISALCMGFGAGVIELITSPLVSILGAARRTNALNILHSFYSLGAVLAVLLASLMIYLGVSWRQVVLGAAILPIVNFFGFTTVIVPPLVRQEQRTRLRTLVRQKFFILSLAAIALCGVSELGIVQWLPAYAEQGLGFPNWIGGFSLMFYSLGMLLGRWIAGSAGHRINPFVLEGGCSIFVAILLLCGSLIPQPLIALIACISVGLAVSCLWPTMLAIVGGEFPSGGVSMFGFLSVCGNAGGIIMPWLIGIVADRAGLRTAIAFASLAPIFLVILLTILAKHGKSDHYSNPPII